MSEGLRGSQLPPASGGVRGVAAWLAGTANSDNMARTFSKTRRDRTHLGTDRGIMGHLLVLLQYNSWLETIQTKGRVVLGVERMLHHPV